MKATQQLHELGQSIWLDNITRDLLNSGTLKRYINDLSLTGLTSNPRIFDQAIKNSSAYDSAIREKLKAGKSDEKLFFELAIEDLSQAAERDLKPELEQFAVNAWRAPKRIFDAHPPDQCAQLRVDLRSPSLWARLPTPVATKAGPVPTHLCLGPDDCENLQD